MWCKKRLIAIGYVGLGWRMTFGAKDYEWHIGGGANYCFFFLLLLFCFVFILFCFVFSEFSLDYYLLIYIREIGSTLFKGALQPHPPIFFSKKLEIFRPWEVYRSTYVVTACLILLATSTQSQRYANFSCGGHFKSTFKNGRHCHDCWIWYRPPLF